MREASPVDVTPMATRVAVVGNGAPHGVPIERSAGRGAVGNSHYDLT